MTTESKKHRSLWEQLQDVYGTYLVNSYTKMPPKKPFSDHWKGQGERAARVLFGMPTIAVAMYDIRTWLLKHNVPLLPYVCELIARGTWHIAIGRKVRYGEKLMIPHGHVIIDGDVQIGDHCTINPWVTIGLSGSRRWGFDARGPYIGDNVYIGTGAKVLGPITIGDGARIGANAVVIDDVPPGATVVGAPARVVHDAPPEWP